MTINPIAIINQKQDKQNIKTENMFRKLVDSPVFVIAIIAVFVYNALSLSISVNQTLNGTHQEAQTAYQSFSHIACCIGVVLSTTAYVFFLVFIKEVRRKTESIIDPFGLNAAYVFTVADNVMSVITVTVMMTLSLIQSIKTEPKNTAVNVAVMIFMIAVTLCMCCFCINAVYKVRQTFIQGCYVGKISDFLISVYIVLSLSAAVSVYNDTLSAVSENAFGINYYMSVARSAAAIVSYICLAITVVRYNREAMAFNLALSGKKPHKK